MADFDTHDAAAGLLMLATTAVERDEALLQFSATNDLSSMDDEGDSPCPYFDKFYSDGGSAAIKSMTNLEEPQFEMIWAHLENFVRHGYNISRGQKSKVSGTDALFMLMVTIKHGGHWDVLARVFKLKGPTFERLVSRFCTPVSKHVYQCFSVEVGNLFTMAELRERRQGFCTFKEAG